MLVIGYLATIVMGLTLGLLGGGGSILTVPILVYLFKIPPVVATVYSLFVVGFTAMLGSVTYVRSGKVDFSTVALFGVPSLTGVFLTRKYLVPAIPPTVATFGQFQLTKDILLMLIFAILMLLASLSMIRSQKGKTPSTTEAATASPKPSVVPIIGQGFFVGIVTGLVGAGGGFLIIPALIFFRGLTMRLAVGTSLVIITINSLFGFANNLFSGFEADWTLLFSLSVIAIFGIQIGSRLSNKTDERLLKKGFGYFVLLMGSYILIQQCLQMQNG